MEVTIEHEGGVDTISEFDLIEVVGPAYDGAEKDIRVWHGEPRDWENASHDMYMSGTITEIEP